MVVFADNDAVQIMDVVVYDDGELNWGILQNGGERRYCYQGMKKKEKEKGKKIGHIFFFFV